MRKCVQKLNLPKDYSFLTSIIHGVVLGIGAYLTAYIGQYPEKICIIFAIYSALGGSGVHLAANVNLKR